MVKKFLQLPVSYFNFRKSIFFGLILIFCIIITFHFSFAQNNFYNDLIVPTGYNPKSMYDLFLDNPTPKSGIKIAQKEKRDQMKEKFFERKVYSDSASPENRINSLKYGSGNDKIYVSLTLANYDQTIQISVYNLLGKKVLDVFDGTPYTDPSYSYEILTSSLPNGVYLCIVVGSNFRLREKFIISRG